MKICIKDNKFKELLIRKGMSQRGFAKEIGISGPYMSQIVKGNRHPGPQISKKICDGLEVGFDDIFFIQNGYKSKQTKTA